jgi:Fe-S-cluster containining protein
MGRAERRQQEKEYRRRVESRGLDVRQLDAHEIVALMRVLSDRVRISIRRRSVNPLMDFIYSNLMGGAKLIAAAPIACRKGCSHCCNIWVDASAPEVFYTVNMIAPEQRERAIAAVETACAQTGGVSFDDRGQMVTPCPLLEGDLCGVYADRPLACRTAVSADAEICRRSYRHLSGEDIPTPAIWMMLRQGYCIALEGAVQHAGLAHDFREWNESLRVALHTPDAEANWLAGADVFAGLPMPSVPATFEHPQWRAIYVEAFGAEPV